MKRKIITYAMIIFGGVILLGITGCSSDDNENPTVNVAYMPDIHGATPLIIGEEKGYFEEAGINVNAIEFDDGPTEFEAMVSGDVDIAYIGPGATYLAAKGQGSIITIDSLNTGDMVLATEESGIESFEDLEGKDVGVPEGTSGEMVYSLGLQQAGVDPDDVDAVNMDVSNGVSAFVSDSVDAVATWAPYTNEIEKEVGESGMTKLADGGDFAPEYTFPQSWVASPEFLEENEEEAVKFLEAWTEANDFRKDNMDEAIEMTAEEIDVPEDSLETMVDTTEFLSSEDILKHYDDGDVNEWYENLQNLFVDTGQMDETTDTEDFVKSKPLEEALK